MTSGTAIDALLDTSRTLEVNFLGRVLIAAGRPRGHWLAEGN